MPPITRQRALVCAALALTVSPVVATVSFIVAALASAVEGRRNLAARRHQVALGAILLVSAWFWHQWVLPERFSPGTVAFTDYVPFYVFFLALCLTPFSDREIRSFLTAFALTVPQQFVLAVGERYWGWAGRFYFPARKLPIIDIYAGPSEAELATSGSFFNPSIFALYCLMAIIFLLSLLLERAREGEAGTRVFLTHPKTVVLLLGVVFGVVLLVWTQSRSAWFFMMVIPFVFSRFEPRWLFRSLGLLMLALTLLAFYNLVFPASAVPYILPDSLTSKLTVFSEDRAKYYHLAWQLIQDKPLTGWGIGMFPRLVPPSVLGYQVLHAHSLPLQLALEVGLPVTVLVLGLTGYLIVAVARGIVRREATTGRLAPLDRGLLVTFVVILLMQGFDLALLMTYRLQFVFWLCLAAPYSRVLSTRVTSPRVGS